MKEVPGAVLVVGPLGLGERLLALTDLLGDEHGVDPVIVDDLGGVAVDLADLVVIELHLVDDGDDFAPSLVEFLQIGRLLAELTPELFMQLGRLHHGVLAEGDVIVEADDLDEVVLLLLVFLELLLDDLLEAVDDELLDKGG